MRALSVDTLSEIKPQAARAEGARRDLSAATHQAAVCGLCDGAICSEEIPALGWSPL